MKNHNEDNPLDFHLNKILEFVGNSPGLKSIESNSEDIQISQETDGKTITFSRTAVEEVISRTDSEGLSFLQVNFTSGKKILITENLVGFKPVECGTLDMTKLPKVVTTPDLISVVEAIEEAMHVPSPAVEELKVLRQVFDSVLKGAESVGFDLKTERIWLQHLAHNPQRASA